VFAAVGVSLDHRVVVSILLLLVSVPAARALALVRIFRESGALLFMLLLPVLAPPLAAAMECTDSSSYGLAETAAGVILVHLIQGVPYAILMLAGSFSRARIRISKRRRGRGGFARRRVAIRHRCRRLRLG